MSSKGMVTLTYVMMT